MTQTETDRFTLGLFSRDTWTQIVTDTGFLVHPETYTDDECHFTTFYCVKR